jgi:hypothetical protein
MHKKALKVISIKILPKTKFMRRKNILRNKTGILIDSLDALTRTENIGKQIKSLLRPAHRYQRGQAVAAVVECITVRGLIHK